MAVFFGASWFTGSPIGFVLGILILIWLIASIRFVGPTERGIPVLFGMYNKPVDSGPVIVPRLPGSFLERFPTTLFVLAYSNITVYFGVGEYTASKEGEDSEFYGRAKGKVSLAIHIYFPKDSRLITTYRARVPLEQGKMQEFFSKTVIGSARAALAKFPWPQATEDLPKVREVIEELLYGGDSGFRNAGFTKEDVSVTITEIILPAGIEKALEEREQRRLQALAADDVSTLRAEETMGAFVKMIRMTRGTEKSEKEIREEISTSEGLQKELREFAQELIKHRMSIDGNSLTHIKIEGAQGGGLGNMLLSLAAVWNRSQNGGTKKSKQERRGKTNSEDEDEDEDDDESELEAMAEKIESWAR